MDEVLFRKLERLKEEILYLEDNKTKFLKSLQTSVDNLKKFMRYGINDIKKFINFIEKL